MVGPDPTIQGATRGLDPRLNAEDDDSGWGKVGVIKKAGALGRPAFSNHDPADQAESLAITSSETSKFE